MMCCTSQSSTCIQVSGKAAALVPKILQHQGDRQHKTFWWHFLEFTQAAATSQTYVRISGKTVTLLQVVQESAPRKAAGG